MSKLNINAKIRTFFKLDADATDNEVDQAINDAQGQETPPAEVNKPEVKDPETGDESLADSIAKTVGAEIRTIREAMETKMTENYDAITARLDALEAKPADAHTEGKRETDADATAADELDAKIMSLSINQRARKK